MSATGDELWRFEAPEGFAYSSPTITPDGAVIVGSERGALYFFEGDSPLASTGWPKPHGNLRNTGRAPGDG